MKICFCNILYSKKDERGGLGSHIRDLSTELAARGHEVVILTSGSPAEYLEDGVRVIQLRAVQKYSNNWQILNPWYLWQRFTYMWKVASCVRKMSFDLLEAAEGGAEHLLVLFSRTCPVVTKLHGNFRYIYGNRRLAPFVEMFERLVVRASDAVYASSNAYAARISADYRIPIDSIKLIPYGIKTRGLSAQTGVSDVLQEYGIPGNYKTAFLAAGASPARKGAPAFLNAAKKLQRENIKFIFACSDNSFLEKTEIPENVVVVPNLERERFHALLRQVDLVVFPTQFESFCIAAYEAMLLGKMMIVSENLPLEGPAALYNRCLVLPNVTADSLACAMQDVLQQKIVLPPANFAHTSRMMHEYDISTVAESTEAYYREICGLASSVVEPIAEEAQA